MITLPNRKISKYLIIILAIFIPILFKTGNAYAAPVRPVEVSLTQPDGTQFMALPWGDEWINGMETVDGYTILLSPKTEFWVYARLTSENRLAPRLEAEEELVVGRDDPSDLPKHIRPGPPVNRWSGPLPETATLQTPNIGDRKILMLLVEFLNTKAQTTPAYWHNKVFGETNSLRHYYQEASFGQMTLTPAAESYDNNADGVVGWLTLPYNHPDTGGDIFNSSRRIALDALHAANPYVNFATFDKNWDGMISYEELHIIIIVAGNETAYGGSAGSCAPNIWGHAWSFMWDAPTFDGVRVAFSVGNGGYIQVGEWHCEFSDLPGHPATMGILAHELGHELGWPDLYDISGRSAGLGYWDVMSNGMWNNSGGNTPDGSSPALPNPWSRWHQGWFTPMQVTTSKLDVSISAIQDSSTAFQLLDNPNGVDWEFNWRSGQGEYYLVENRQQVGYDVGLPGSGLLVWHINESRPFDNSANADPNNRLVDLVQADGLRQLNITNGNRGDPGDPFPGTTHNRVFNISSNPSSKINGLPSGVSITNISNNGPLMTANFFVNSYMDVVPTDWFWEAVEALTAVGITNGCGEGNFCPGENLSRAQMAVLLLRAIKGSTYVPPAGTGFFNDVPQNHWAADWIEAVYAEGITVGCGVDPLRFCPEDSVSRAEMAVLLIRSQFGLTHSPPPAQGIFMDVPNDYWAADWIEELYTQGITTGCALDPLRYCPEQYVTRAEISVFLMRTFSLSHP